MNPRRRGVIPAKLANCLDLMAPACPSFVLAGGTSLAEFYLGHRLSFDLDFFTRSISDVDEVEQAFPIFLKENGFQFETHLPIRGAANFFLSVAPAPSMAPATLPRSGRSQDDALPAMKIQFCTSPVIDPARAVMVGSVRVASLENIIEMKWEAFHREELKDLFDLVHVPRELAERSHPHSISFLAPAIVACRTFRDLLSEASPPGWYLPAGDWDDDKRRMIEFADEFSARFSRVLFAPVKNEKV